MIFDAVLSLNGSLKLKDVYVCKHWAMEASEPIQRDRTFLNNFYSLLSILSQINYNGFGQSELSRPCWLLRSTVSVCASSLCGPPCPSCLSFPGEAQASHLQEVPSVGTRPPCSSHPYSLDSSHEVM